MSLAARSTPFLTTDQNESDACPCVTTAILMSERVGVAAALGAALAGAAVPLGSAPCDGGGLSHAIANKAKMVPKSAHSLCLCMPVLIFQRGPWQVMVASSHPAAASSTREERLM